MSDPLDGVTATQVTVPMDMANYLDLAATIAQPETERVTHELVVGQFKVPGRWLVVGLQFSVKDGVKDHWVTLARIQE